MLVPYYCLLVAIWSTLFMEFWKRFNAKLVFRWDMTDFEVEEKERALFKPLEQKDERTGERKPVYKAGVYTKRGFVEVPKEDREKYEQKHNGESLPELKFFPRAVTQKRQGVALSVAATCAVIVIIVAFSILYVRLLLGEKYDGDGFKTGTSIAAIINGVSIAVLNVLYGIVARKLTEWENHRTNTEFEDNLSSKLFMFQFINSYFSLFYVAFLKTSFSLFGRKDSCTPDCMTELVYQLGTIFLTKQATGQLLEFGLPWVKGKLTVFLQRRSAKSAVKAAAKDAAKQPVVDGRPVSHGGYAIGDDVSPARIAE